MPPPPLELELDISLVIDPPAFVVSKLIPAFSRTGLETQDGLIGGMDHVNVVICSMPDGF